MTPDASGPIRPGHERRRLPRWSEVRPLLGGGSYYGTSRSGDAMTRATSIWDLRAIARRRVPRAVFDYVDGAAERERSLRRARMWFDSAEFRPRVLRDVSRIETSTSLLGQSVAFPLVCAPTGFTRMVHWTGERAVARAAAGAGVPYTLSTFGTSTPEAVADAAPAGANWFQLYVGRDRDKVEAMVDRAASAGFSALMVTVDAPVAGSRSRDAKNGLTIPPSLTLRTIADMARYPRWWANVLTREPLALALDPDAWTSADAMARLLDPALDLDYLATLRAQWPGSFVVKGVQSVEDAAAVVDLGADAVVLSNHGGRQLDRARIPMDLLPDVVEALDGAAEVYVDGGVLSGADIAIALALGANAVLVGRAYLYGLMAGGQDGVERAMDILGTELARTMRLLGAASIPELVPDLVHVPRG